MNGLKQPFDKLRANGGCDFVQHFYLHPFHEGLQ